MQLDITFDSYPGNEVFKPYRGFYEDAIIQATKDSNSIKLVELGSDVGISGRMIAEILDKIGKPWTMQFVDVNYRVELSRIIDNSNTFFLHKGWSDAIVDFEDGSIDVLHIDVGNHTAEESKLVFEAYKNKVKDNGVMLWHDASPLEFTVYNFLSWELQPISGWEVVFCPESGIYPQAAPASCRRIK